MRLDEKKYKVFSLADNQLVAIDIENQKVLQHCLSIWRSLADVPVDRTVRGLFVKRSRSGFVSEEDLSQLNDITINQLRPVDQ